LKIISLTKPSPRHTFLQRFVAHRSYSANSFNTQIQLCRPQYCTTCHYSRPSHGKRVISATGKIVLKFLHLQYSSIHCIKPLWDHFVVLFLLAMQLKYMHTEQSHNWRNKCLILENNLLGQKSSARQNYTHQLREC